ncbi:MAG: ABC transporter ATP-binding protein [Mesorhizobium sp.]|nr:MAG: ABC transporter ATP-binding protein [Mesorhizobium sp.]
MKSQLEITGLTVRFPIMSRLMARLRGIENHEIDAVADVSLTVREGETYALVGESGSGKSTLARTVIGLVRATPGSTILFDGRDLASMSPSVFKVHRRNMAMMFQDPIGSLSPRMTVGAQLIEPFLAHKLSDRDLEAECHRLLDMVSLPRDFAHRYPYELSGGQARRVGLARSLALGPKLVIADEPTAGLDVSVQGEVLNLLNELQERLGLTLLIITHNLQIVRHIAHRTGIMYLGRVIEEGPTNQTFQQPRHPYTQALLSAAPKPDPDSVQTRIELKGEIPSLARRPSGCEFHTRCPRASDVCSINRPVETVEGQRRYRCHFPLRAEEENALAVPGGSSLENFQAD